MIEIEKGKKILQELGYDTEEYYNWCYYFAKTTTSYIYSISINATGIRKERLANCSGGGLDKVALAPREQEASDLIFKGLKKSYSLPTYFTEEEKKKYNIQFDSGYVYRYYNPRSWGSSIQDFYSHIKERSVKRVDKFPEFLEDCDGDGTSIIVVASSHSFQMPDRENSKVFGGVVDKTTDKNVEYYLDRLFESTQVWR